MKKSRSGVHDRAPIREEEKMKKRITLLLAMLMLIGVFIVQTAGASDYDYILFYNSGYINIFTGSNTIPQGSVIVAAQYDGDTLVKSKIYDTSLCEDDDSPSVKKIDVRRDFNKFGAKVKFMLWNSAEDMRPLCSLAETTIGSLLESGEKYGWIMDASEKSGKTLVKLYSMDNEVIEAPLASIVHLWGPADTCDALYDAQDAGQKILSAIANDEFVKCGDYSVRLVKYLLNDANEISKFYCAVNSQEAGALTVSASNFKGYPLVSGSVGGYILNDGITEFNVPREKDAEILNNTENYSAGTVDAENYAIAEIGSSRDYTLGEFSNTIYPNVLINFTSSLAPAFDEMDSSGSGPMPVLVNSFENAKSEFVLSAYIGSDIPAALSLPKKAAIGELKDSVWASNWRMYGVNTLWNTDMNTTPDGVIEEGDTVLCQGNKLFAKYVSASKLYNHIVNGTEYGIIGARPSKSAARSSYYLGKLESKGMTKQRLWVKLDCADNNFFFSEGKVINRVWFNKTTGEIETDTTNLAGLRPFNAETKTGDILFISLAGGTGNVSCITAYHFADGPNDGKEILVEPPIIDKKRLQEGEKYGWIMDAYDNADGETVVKLYTQDNEAAEMKLAGSVDYWAPEATANVRTDKTEVSAAIKGLISDDKFINVKISSKSSPIRLVKYSAEDNIISKLYCAVDAAKTDSEAAVVADPVNLMGFAPSAGAVNNRLIGGSGIVEFNVPADASDMTDAGAYSVGTADTKNYVVGETGSFRNFITGEYVYGYEAGIIVNFISSPKMIASFGEMDTTGSGPEIMVVDEVNTVTDADGKHVYEIKGYFGGSKVSVTTNERTNVGRAKKNLYNRVGGQTVFDAEELWNANSPLDVSLAGFIKQGDIILYTPDGSLVIQYASAADAKFDAEGRFIPESIRTINGNGYYSAVRVSYYFGAIEAVDYLDDSTAFVKIANSSNNICFDTSKMIDLVNISKDGGVTVSKEAVTVSDLENGDYLLVNLADKSTNIKSLIVYRTEK